MDVEYRNAARNIEVGERGETLVFEKLQDKEGVEVEYVSRKDASKHYDILETVEGKKTYIEVKTVSYNGSRPKTVRIYISQSEVEFSMKKKENYQLHG